MRKGNVKGGTPVGTESLCRTCSNALIMTGYKESEMVAMCSWVNPNIPVPFRIYECTGYYDKNKPTWQQMQRLAIHVSPGTLKPVGFKVGAGFAGRTAVVDAEGEEDLDECEED